MNERDSPNIVGRDGKGRFVKGHAPNGAGRKKQTPEFRELLSTNAPKALEAVVKIMNDPGASNRDRLTAASIILERAYGKVPTALVIGEPKVEALDDIRQEMEKIRQQSREREEGEPFSSSGGLDDIRAEMERMRRQENR